MKRIKAIFGMAFALIFGSVHLSAAEKLESLLPGYLANSTELQQLANQMQKVMIENEMNEISNGFSFKLSTGTITFTTGDSWNIKFTPTASFSIPDAKNLGISVSSTILFDSSDSTDTFTNSSLKVSVDIISNNTKNREINALKSQRKVLEAQRKVQNGFVSVEKEFYEKVKSLYEMASKILTLEKSLYDNQLKLETLKSQGYTTSSTKYKTAQMNVMNDQYDVDSQMKSMEREVKIFCAKCGVEYKYDSPLSFLPTEIPDVEAVKITSYSPEKYTKIESLTWTHYINELERETDSSISLSANAGFTFNNERTSSHSIDLGSNFTWNDTGLVLNVGTNIPVGTDSFSPFFTLGVSFDPTAFKTAKLNKELDSLESSQEEIDIENAKSDFGTVAITQNTSLENIMWEKSTCKESYEMYSSLEADMAKYYRQGYISKTEYNNASVNKETSRIKVLINKLNLIIYNNETTLLFVRDEELREDKSNQDVNSEKGESNDVK